MSFNSNSTIKVYVMHLLKDKFLKVPVLKLFPLSHEYNAQNF
ncbi:hypothetical protein PUN28_001963 [Cardiocondyla obscurior]|uniref:Uncharacterized protein n=1 Tax=Cardiocondyla obscurior TaxID=286306 RepID=A0AAW2GS11_9HYME